MTNGPSISNELDRERDANVYVEGIDDIPIDLGYGSIQVPEPRRPRHVLRFVVIAVVTVIFLVAMRMLFV